MGIEIKKVIVLSEEEAEEFLMICNLIKCNHLKLDMPNDEHNFVERMKIFADKVKEKLE